MTLTEFQELIRTFTQDAKPYLDESWPGAPDVLKRDELIAKLITLAVAEISRYAVRLKIEDEAGADTALYELNASLQAGKRIFPLSVKLFFLTMRRSKYRRRLSMAMTILPKSGDGEPIRRTRLYF